MSDTLGVFAERDVECPYGGATEGGRTSCRFGHPGCVCVDELSCLDQGEPAAALAIAHDEIRRLLAALDSLRRAAEVEPGDPRLTRLPGTSGNYASVPDDAALDLTGDVDLVVHLAEEGGETITAQLLAVPGVEAVEVESMEVVTISILPWHPLRRQAVFEKESEIRDAFPERRLFFQLQRYRPPQSEESGDE